MPKREIKIKEIFRHHNSQEAGTDRFKDKYKIVYKIFEESSISHRIYVSFLVPTTGKGYHKNFFLISPSDIDNALVVFQDNYIYFSGNNHPRDHMELDELHTLESTGQCICVGKLIHQKYIELHNFIIKNNIARKQTTDYLSQICTQDNSEEFDKVLKKFNI